MSTLKVNNILPVDSTGIHIIGSSIINALIDGYYKGAWTPNTQYQINDVVIRNNNFYKALEVNNKPSFTASDWVFHQVNIFEYLRSHVNNRRNPHSVTKAQVGLGLVQNYRIASTAEAVDGNSEELYMTPKRVKESIQANVVITKQAIGLGNVDNFSTLTEEEARSEDPYVTNRFVTPHTMNILLEGVNFLQGHPLFNNGVLLERMGYEDLPAFHICDGTSFPDSKVLDRTFAGNDSATYVKEYCHTYTTNVDVPLTNITKTINAGDAAAVVYNNGSVRLLREGISVLMNVDSSYSVTDVIVRNNSTYIIANNSTTTRIYISHGITLVMLHEFPGVYTNIILRYSEIHALRPGSTVIYNMSGTSLVLPNNITGDILNVSKNSGYEVVLTTDGVFYTNGELITSISNIAGSILYVGTLNTNQRINVIRSYNESVIETTVSSIGGITNTPIDIPTNAIVGINSDIKLFINGGELMSVYQGEPAVTRNKPSFQPTGIIACDRFIVLYDNTTYTTTRRFTGPYEASVKPCIPPYNNIYTYVRLP